jgi:transposase
MDALAIVCASGCAVLFSPTSDGGAISVTVYAGDERARDYASDAEEFAAVLLAVRDTAEAHAINHTHPAVKAARNGPKST